jgi:hypothetical protein
MLEPEYMQDDSSRLKNIKTETIREVRVGWLISPGKKGGVLVDYPDNRFDPLPACSTVIISESDKDKKVLLLFENGDPKLPIIIGIIQDQPVRAVSNKEAILDKNEAKDLLIDGEKIVFDAKKEIVLRCGKGSITVRADGKIVVKGTNLLSRSSGPQRIKGASVNIN